MVEDSGGHIRNIVLKQTLEGNEKPNPKKEKKKVKPLLLIKRTVGSLTGRCENGSTTIKM